MEALKALDRIEQLEVSLASMYEKLAALFQEDKDAVVFFERMKSDEISHADLVRMQKRFVRRDMELFSDITIDQAAIEDTIEIARTLPSAGLSLDNVIRKVCSIEASAAEKYAVGAMQRANREFAKFLIALAKTMIDHNRALADFAHAKGFDVGEYEEEQRMQARVGYTQYVMINRMIRCNAVDLSEGGIFLLTGRFFEIGSTVVLEFPAGGLNIRTKARVQFNRKNAGTGFMFIELTDEQKAAIRKHVELSLKQGPGDDKLKKVILFVRNEVYTMTDLNIYVSSLLKAGFMVIEAKGAAEVVRLVGEYRRFDLSIVAVASEDDSNFDMLYFLRETSADRKVPLFVLSLNNSPAFAKQVIAEGADMFLNKFSTNPKKLVDTVVSTLKSQNKPASAKP